jgi:ATP-dependent Clp protease adaptor protein ClpS
MRFMFNDTATDPFEADEVDLLTAEQFPYNLIVWNDEVNTFDWVIETLIEVCGHTQEQAEQCSLIIHFKGKCAVKNGDYEELKPMCDAITERGIGATIEITVER